VKIDFSFLKPIAWQPLFRAGYSHRGFYHLPLIVKLLPIRRIKAAKRQDPFIRFSSIYYGSIFLRDICVLQNPTNKAQ
jgi:hypothetical protein